MYKANFDIPYLLALPPHICTKDIRAYTGHFPFYVTQLVHPPRHPTTMTILREPVQRTISYLQQQVHDDPSTPSSSRRSTTTGSCTLQ